MTSDLFLFRWSWKRLFLLFVLLVGVFSFSSLKPVQAATCVYTSLDMLNDFHTPGNWTDCEGGVPGSDDDVIIPAGQTAIVSSNVTVSGLYVTGTLRLTSSNFTTGGNTLIDVGGVVTSTVTNVLFNGPVITNNGALGTDTGYITSNNVGVNNGDIDLGHGTFNGWITTNNGTIHGNDGTLLIGNSWTQGVAGEFDPDRSSVWMNGLGPQNVPFSTLYGLRIMNTLGAVSLGVDTVVTGPLTVESGATFNIGSTISTFSGMITISGTMQASTGEIIMGPGNATIGGVLRTTGAGRISMTGGFTSVNVGGVVTSTIGSLVFHGNVGSSGAIGSSEGNIWFDGAFTNDGTLENLVPE